MEARDVSRCHTQNQKKKENGSWSDPHQGIYLLSPKNHKAPYDITRSHPLARE